MSLALATPDRSVLVMPRTIRLPLSGEQWVEVRERLNHGEHTALNESLYVLIDGDYVFNPLKWNDAIVIAFLVDWNLTGDDGQVLPIRGTSRDELAATLRHIDEDAFLEIKSAVQTHVDALSAARAEKKRRRTTGTASSAT